MMTDERLELADKLDAKALATVREVTASVLGATTYAKYLDFAERALRISDILRARTASSTREGL